MLSNSVRDALNDNEKSVKGSKILILGVAYKKDIDDMRESPALSVIDLLALAKARMSFITIRSFLKLHLITLTRSATANRFTI